MTRVTRVAVWPVHGRQVLHVQIDTPIVIPLKTKDLFETDFDAVVNEKMTGSNKD